MNDQTDLTRWNRASLSRFRYIDGNALTYLETLRQALLLRFADPVTATLQWGDLVPRRAGDSADAYVRFGQEQVRLQGETDRERLDRLRAQYEGPRRDWAWEIARVLARAAHVLTETIDVYANEGYLRTATQWDNVRRLVEMLDYHPAPPASASTNLVIEGKKKALGTLATGFQVKYSPPDGGAPVLFETLEALDVNVDLNGLRPAEYNRNPNRLSGSWLTLEDEVEGLDIGDPLVLEDRKTGVLRAHLILGLQVVDGLSRLQVTPRLSQRLQKGYTRVHLKPKDRLDPIGPAAKGAELERVVRLTDVPRDLLPGMVLHITDGVETSYRRLVFVRGQRLVLDADIGILRLDEGLVGQPVTIGISKKEADPRTVTSDNTVIYSYSAAGDWSRLAGAILADKRKGDQGKILLPTYRVTAARYHPADGPHERRGYTILTLVWDQRAHDFPLDNPQTLLAPPATPGPWQVDTYLEKSDGHLPATLIAEKPKKTSAGDLAVVAAGRQMAWTRLAAVTLDEEKETASLIAEDRWFDRGGGDFFLTETTLYAHFKKTVQLKDWQLNTRPLTGKRIPLAGVPAGLEKGRTIMLENSADASAAFFTTVANIDTARSPVELILSRDLPTGFTIGNTLIAGNVVLAGHGETKGEKVLGSGNATMLSQTFRFEEPAVSFVADATQPSGVRAAVIVQVAGRAWEQVASFQDSRPTDFHYTVHMTEDATLKISFGDGQRGRRLPTGGNNVRITFRKGVGLSGNVAAGSLAKPAKAHRLVDKVRQPMAATGGNDMEGVESLRENAPATLLTLERAVSLADFFFLAMSQSSVWQARAFSRPTGLGRSQKVDVVVVPAGGGELGSLGATLTRFLLNHAIPGVEVTVLPYQEATFSLEVLLTVDAEQFIPEEVVAAVEKALQGVFSLQKRGLGQDLFLSEVYAVVEAVAGVDHSVAVINGDKALRRREVSDRQVLVLGSLLVDFEGSGTARDAPTTTAAETPRPQSSRLVGRRTVQIIQGVGSRYRLILRGRGVRTLDDLARFEDVQVPGMSAVRLAEFKAKARIILDLQIDAFSGTALLSRSVRQLLQAGTTELVRDSQMSVDAVRRFEGQLRILQAVVDEQYLDSLTLRELLTGQSLG
jgi:Baseplate J-like protein